MNRKKERENTFILIFEEIFSEGQDPDEILDIAVNEAEIQVTDYVRNLFLKTITNKEEIDKIISKYCKKWTINRISKTSLAIIRMAVAEIIFDEDISVKVTINEAVELSKKYSSKDDYKFVNGVLSSVVKEQING